MILNYLELSGLIIILTFPLAYFIGRTKIRIWFLKRFSLDFVGIILGWAVVFFVDFLLEYLTGVSFLSLLRSGSSIPVVVFIAGVVLGIAWEYLGQVVLKVWGYPLVERFKIFLIALPFAWGLFMFLLQDTYAILRYFHISRIFSFMLTVLLVGILLEGFNLISGSWQYRKWLKNSVALVLLWLFGVATFIYGFNLVFFSPFGF